MVANLRNDAASNEPQCKGCSASVHVSEETITTLLQGIIHGESPGVVGQDHYSERMTACYGCESLQFGTTCRWCGCLVAVKAKLEKSTCPHPSGSRW